MNHDDGIAVLRAHLAVLARMVQDKATRVPGVWPDHTDQEVLAQVGAELAQLAKEPPR